MYKQRQAIYKKKVRSREQMIYKIDTAVTVKRLTIPVESREQLLNAAETLMNVARDLRKVLNRKNNFYNTKIETCMLMHETNALLKSQASENGEEANYKGAK